MDISTITSAPDRKIAKEILDPLLKIDDISEIGDAVIEAASMLIWLKNKNLLEAYANDKKHAKHIGCILAELVPNLTTRLRKQGL